jgi:hypothetical protein
VGSSNSKRGKRSRYLMEDTISESWKNRINSERELSSKCRDNSKGCFHMSLMIPNLYGEGDGDER